MAIDIATKIRSLIDARGIADATLARALGVSSTAIRRWTLRPDEYRPGESVRRPTVPQLLALARYFDVSMEYLADPEIAEPGKGGWSPEERAVVAIYRHRRRVEGDAFTPEEMVWRAEVPRYADAPAIGDAEPEKSGKKESGSAANRAGGGMGA